MMKVKGEVRVDYLHLDCGDCGKPVELDNLRWAGGVPMVEVACPKCDRRDDLKLWAITWATVLPPPE